jgi:RNA polymerase sigma factor (sigma-70 family)
MSQDRDFRELILCVRAGDEQAAAELVRRYEPVIRRAVRLRLQDQRLRRVFDSMDVCQSVLASFFLRAAAGQYELTTPDQLLRLLAVMARNKLGHQVARQQAACRDHRRVEALANGERDVIGPDSTPSRQVAQRELLSEARRRLSPDERRLMEMRGEGRQWEDIARELGATAEALRKKLTGAIERVRQELGLAEVTHV